MNDIKQCMKCQSTDNLSVRYYTKTTKEARYYCNQCRANERLRNKKPNKQQDDYKARWNEMFKESYERLSKRAM